MWLNTSGLLLNWTDRHGVTRLYDRQIRQVLRQGSYEEAETVVYLHDRAVTFDLPSNVLRIGTVPCYDREEVTRDIRLHLRRRFSPDGLSRPSYLAERSFSLIVEFLFGQGSTLLDYGRLKSAWLVPVESWHLRELGPGIELSGLCRRIEGRNGRANRVQYTTVAYVHRLPETGELEILKATTGGWSNHHYCPTWNEIKEAWRVVHQYWTRVEVTAKFFWGPPPQDRGHNRRAGRTQAPALTLVSWGAVGRPHARYCEDTHSPYDPQNRFVIVHAGIGGRIIWRTCDHPLTSFYRLLYAVGRGHIHTYSVPEVIPSESERVSRLSTE